MNIENQSIENNTIENVVYTASYKCFVVNGIVTIAKCLVTGKFVKLSLAQDEYHAFIFSGTCKTSSKQDDSGLALLYVFATLLAAIIFTVYSDRFIALFQMVIALFDIALNIVVHSWLFALKAYVATVLMNMLYVFIYFVSI